MIILVDLVNTLYIKEKGIDEKLMNILDSYDCKKIIVTNATADKLNKMGELPYEVYTFEGNPRKEDSKYFKSLMKKLVLDQSDILYIEHNLEAIKLAKTLGIKTFHYDKDKKDHEAVDEFLKREI